MNRTMITAHAGAEGTRANSVESLRAQIASGADAIEVDVRANGAGELVLSHNELETDMQYVSLRTCLEMAREKAGLMVNADLKEEGLLERVCALADEVGAMGQVLFTGSVDKEDIEYALKNAVPLWYNVQLLTEAEKAEPMRAVRERGLAVFNTYHGVVTQELLNADAGNISVWTVDTTEELKRFLNAGVMNITTRHPIEAIKLRSEM